MRGSEVSLGGLGKYLLIQCQIGHGLAKAFILLLQPFQLLELVNTHAAILLAPAIERLLGYLHLPDRINTRHSLAAKHLNLSQLRDNLFRLVSLDSHV